MAYEGLKIQGNFLLKDFTQNNFIQYYASNDEHLKKIRWYML